jgi:hypothetical protein
MPSRRVTGKGLGTGVATVSVTSLGKKEKKDDPPDVRSPERGPGARFSAGGSVAGREALDKSTAMHWLAKVPTLATGKELRPVQKLLTRWAKKEEGIGWLRVGQFS